MKKSSSRKKLKRTVMNQIQIRPSQFITTYGVGSTIDGPDGPSMILDYRLSKLFPSLGAPEGKYMGVAPEALLIDARIGTRFGFSLGEGPLPAELDSALYAIEWVIENKDTTWNGAPDENKGIDIILRSKLVLKFMFNLI